VELGAVLQCRRVGLVCWRSRTIVTFLVLKILSYCLQKLSLETTKRKKKR